MNDAQFNEVLKRFDALAAKLGPEITDTVLTVAQAAAYRDMVFACLWALSAVFPLLLALGFGLACWHCCRSSDRQEQEGQVPCGLIATLSFAVGVWIIAFNLYAAFNPLAVAGRVNPKVYLAQRILEL